MLDHSQLASNTLQASDYEQGFLAAAAGDIDRALGTAASDPRPPPDALRLSYEETDRFPSGVVALVGTAHKSAGPVFLCVIRDCRRGAELLHMPMCLRLPCDLVCVPLTRSSPKWTSHGLCHCRSGLRLLKPFTGHTAS